MEGNPMKSVFLACLTLFLSLNNPARALSADMTPFNGADGAFETVKIGNDTVFRASGKGSNFSGFMYFARTGGAKFKEGADLYLEVDFLDLGGPGRLGLQYNSAYQDYQQGEWLLNASVGSSGKKKTAYFILHCAKFKANMAGNSDLRLAKGYGDIQFHVLKVRVSDAPGPAFKAAAAVFGPYDGPSYRNGKALDASTLNGKVICGYQGWFRSPDDDDNMGWQHFIPNWGGEIGKDNIAIDYWPDMTEFTPAEKHEVKGYTYPGGAQAHLFSSDNARTVLRHFQLMETWGIDGVALQRNCDDLVSRNSDVLRQLTYVRDAAMKTGRVWYVEYALDLHTTMAGLPQIQRDWQYLVDEMKITQDPCYLHHNGKPVVGLYGFYKSQIDTFATAGAALDIFQKGLPQYQGFVIGAGFWPWRIDAKFADWKPLIYRMGGWQGWNVGNAADGHPPNTDYYPGDKADLDAHGVMFQPLIYPGGSAFNREKKSPPGKILDRMKGDFIWAQFARARQISAQSVFIAMFDEIDEGTAIFKVTNAPPSQHWFRDYEGLPSDCYLCYTGQGGKMMRGEIPLTTTKPDCPKMTQASIPEPVSPAEAAVAAGPSVAISYGRAFPAQGAKAGVRAYELDVDGKITSSPALAQTRILPAGGHYWRVRSLNNLGNRSSWSLKTYFNVKGKK
jgi:hypothetical protein